ncbi:MAG TPA: hypothetical protein VLX92_31455 [Kofleriaceae bacterium]|nr:hypothetical protein [Kofleriaceae bacterium]
MRAYLLVLALILAACASGKAKATQDAGVPQDAVAGHAATGQVSGGTVSTSQHYKLVGSMSAHASTASSPSYSIKTGVVGASQ